MRSTPDAGKEVGHGPLAGFRSKLIDFRTMPPALRIMSVAAILALVGTGASLVLIQVHQPRVQTALNVNGQATDVPLVALLMLAVVGGLGYTYALAGAMQMRWHLRLFVVALVTLGLGFIPTLYLLSSLDFTDSLLAAQTALHVGQIIVLALIWVWAIGIALFRRQEPAGVPPRRHYAAAFAAALGLIAACYGLSLAIWLVYRGSGARLAAFGDVFLTDEIVAPIYVFPFILPLFIYWASTDTVEWSTTLAGTIAERIRRLPWLLPALAALAAVALVVYDMLTSHSGLLPALVVAALLAGGAVLVLGLGAAPDDWPAQVPVTALLAGVVFLFAAIDLPSLLLGLLAAVGWLRQAMVTPLSGAATLVVDTLGIAGGLALAALGRLRRRGVLTIIGLLLALEAGLTLASELDIVQARIGVMLIPQPKHILVGIELGAALSTLAVIGVLALRRQALAQWAAPLTGALIALGGLVAIDAANTYALARLNVTSRAASVIALVFLATVLWDVATSGQQVTNRDSAAAPRPGRVLLYFGYSLIAAALFLYAAALRIQGTNAPIPQYLVGEDGATAIAGLYLLGIPLALTIGIAHGWRGLTLPRREQTGRARVAFAGTLVAGVLVVMLVATLSAMAALAHVPTPPVYRTHKPGPNCDTQGANWVPPVGSPVPVCLANGLQITANAGQYLTQVGFVFPGGFKSNDYDVSVRVTFDQAGCAGLITRGSERGFYQHQICADGSWSMLALDFNTGQPHYLGIGNVTSSPSYILGVTDRGSRLTMAIDGVTVASATNTQFSDGFIDLGVFNGGGNAPVAATFSDFVYAPLT